MNEKNPQDIPPKDANRERDDFWSIDKLLPKSMPSSKPMVRPSNRSTETVDVELSPAELKSNVFEKDSPYTDIPLASHEPRAEHGRGKYATGTKEQSEEPILVYQGAGSLIHTVKVYLWRMNYHYFDQFVKDAQRYAKVRGTEARKEPFFSYFPQYAQLGRRQLAWYLWWREKVREGVYLETDYAYVLLYLFELLNLPVTEAEAESARDLMAKVWVVYRTAYPQLDHYMCEWLCDYCLIHCLTAPIAILMPVLSDVISASKLKEFYLSAMITVGDSHVNLSSVRVLLAYCCQYDYRKSKFANGEHKQLFDTLVPGAISAAFPLLFDAEGTGVALAMDDSMISRDAYVGALCAFSNKRRIEVSYTSFSRSHDLRFLIGDMVRHIENRIRGSIGVRSRLTTHFLGNSMKEALDAWLDPRLPSPSTSSERALQKEPRPSYEALYDLPSTGISLFSADEIEKSSWDTTRILTETFADDRAFDCALGEEIFQPITKQDSEIAMSEISVCPAPTASSPLLDALGDSVTFLKAALDGDREGQRAYCQTTHSLPDAVADEINAITAEHEIFDMVLEDAGGYYTVIDDYKSLLTEILNGDK